MFERFSDVIAAIDDLKERGLIQDYAIGGAVAQTFWDEAIPTFDLDVLILLAPTESFLISLEPIYQWAAERGYEKKAEHIVISGIPVQFLPTFNPLSEEAVKEAKTLELDEKPIRVVRPEHLIALWLQPPANTNRRKERVAKMHESVELDEGLLAALLERYSLSW